MVRMLLAKKSHIGACASHPFQLLSVKETSYYTLVVVKPWRNIISSLMGLQVMRSKISWLIL